MSALPPDIASGFLSDPADLSKLSLINAEKVNALVAQLNAQTKQTQSGRKRIVVIGTGGTLSMKEENGIRTPDLNFTEIFDLIDPSLQKRFAIYGLDAFKIDSAQMDYRHVQDLAITMYHIWTSAQVDIAGFLVLHGTDTLAYSGAAMSMIMGQGLPFSIAYTAAQQPIQAPINDARRNIRNAIYTLESLHDSDMAEVVSVMGSKAYLSSSAIKIHDLSSDALSAPLHPPITDFTMLDYPVKLAPFLNPRRRNVPFSPTIWQGAHGHTLIVRSRLGLPPAMIARQVEDPNIRAIILYSYGAGTVYNGIIDAVMDGAQSKGLPVFIVSPVNTHYKVVYQSAKDLIARGATPLYMTLPAALAKMEIALRLHTDDCTAIARFMSTNYVGEVPPHA